MKLRKKIVLFMIGFFVIHVLTWWIWGDEKLITRGLNVIEYEQQCEPDSMTWYDYEEISYLTDFQEDIQTKIEYRNRIFTFERADFSSFPDSSVIYYLSRNLDNPFFQDLTTECGESVYFHMHPYYTEIFIWSFFGWIKLFDEEDLERWAS